MQDRHLNRQQYFKEQSHTCRNYYIPYLKSHVGDAPFQGKVLEVGCGEGGNLVPFSEMGCEVTGVDMSPTRISEAKTFFEEFHLKGQFIASDIFKLTDFHGQFPLIIIHDVIEHIGDKLFFLEEMKKYLCPGGILFVAFPAWQMPFGGHQQIARSKFLSHCPFIHLLPRPLYDGVIRLNGENEGVRSELLSIKETHCPIELFQCIVKRAGYTILHRQLYLINPNYETKFGLKPRRLSSCISAIPYVRDFFSTTCFYLLKEADVAK